MTQQMWRHATRDALIDPRVSGCIGKPGETDYAMVVCYGLPNNTREVEYAVPMTADGDAPYPFGDVKNDLPRLSEKQRADILSYKMPKVEGAVERHPFSIENARTDAVAAPEGDARKRNPPVARVEYYLDPTGVPLSLAHSELGFLGRDSAGQDSFLSGPHFVLLPASQPRPAAERIADIAAAVVGTPFVAALDIVLDPMLFWQRPTVPATKPGTED